MSEYDDLGYSEVVTGAPETFVKPADLKTGATWHGVYCGSFWSYGPPDQPFETPARQHRLYTTDHKLIGLPGKGNITSKLEACRKGTFVKIEVLGKRAITTGALSGKESLQWSVQPAAKDNAATLALKKECEDLPDYQPEKPEALAPLSDEAPDMSPPDITGGTANLFAHEQIPLLT